METNLERIQDVYRQLGEGKALEAFEQYYANDVVMIEGDGKVREGKDTNRKAEEEFFGSVAEMHGAGVDAITTNGEDVTMVENWMDVTFKDGNRMKLEQIARQKWNSEGKIIEERFYYNS